MTSVIIFILGTIVGSFLNAVIYRLKSGESIIKKRSHCPKCGHVLSWYELIPVISFIVQKRRCRACKAFISWQYPLVELATGFLFVIIAAYVLSLPARAFGAGGQIAYLCVITSALIVIFVYDLKHYLIPDKIVYPAIAIAFLYRVFEILSFSNWDLIENWKLKIENLGMLYEPLASALISALFFSSIFVLSRGRWLGFGDVKLVFLMGLFLGWPNILVALFLAFILGGIIGIALIAFGKKTLKSQVPFGPFLIAGTFVALFWGIRIWEWYSNFFI